MNIELKDLKNLLDEQKKETANYITRNLTVYTWHNKLGFETEDVKDELRKEVLKSPYPNEYKVLEKYLAKVSA